MSWSAPAREAELAQAYVGAAPIGLVTYDTDSINMLTELWLL